MAATASNDLGLARLLQQRLRSFGDNIAIEQGQNTVTFNEVHQRALSVCKAIRTLVLENEQPVPILATRGIHHVVCQVAAIYAGGTCVPVDVDLPDTHIESLLQHIGASTVLTDTENSHRCPSLQHILVNSSIPQTNGVVAQAIEISDNGPTSCCHIFFTSGSTGNPKAVQVLAKGIINLVFNDTFQPISRGSRVGHVCNIGFDVSLWEIWSSLLHGAVLITFNRHEILDPPDFAQKLIQDRVDVLWQTTSLLATIAHICPSAYAPLDTLLTGGEAINIQTMRTIFSNGPPRRLFNVYGPTELSVLATYHEVSPEDVQKGNIPIGRPLAGYKAFIVDENLNLLPDGEVGELVVGGTGVAAGYIGNPGKTALAFFNAPHLYREGLLYRTGDLVLRNKAGLLEYLGRRDNEVKIRGQRVDLESIERCLLQTDLVSTAVALKVAESAGGSTLLVAYVVPSASDISPALVKEEYARLFPHLMMPRLQAVDAIALTPSGKVDRKRLVCEFEQELQNYSSLCESRKSTSIQDRLQDLWGGVLKLPTDGLRGEDDFFAIGGTSLHAARLIFRINESFHISLRVAALFESPTLSEMCDEVKQAKCGGQPDNVMETPLWVQDMALGGDLKRLNGSVPDWRSRTEGHVFLTGATGFVGSFMLVDLLAHPQVQTVACLVRAENEARAFLRIQNALKRFGLAIQPEVAGKIIAIPGDLAHDELGLDQEQYQRWARWSSVVFHLAAHVNFVQPYPSHRAVNVLGTINMIRFSQEGRQKALHYTSSISAYGPTGLVNQSRYLTENERPELHKNALEFDTGYAQSQFTAETVLWNAIDIGIPIAIHRLGLVLGHSKTGRMNSDDFVSRLVTACIQTGVYPSLPRHREEIVPVDFVVSSILQISSDSQNLGQAYNIVQPQQDSMSLHSLFHLVNQQYTGRSLRGVPYMEWVATLSETSNHPLSSLIPMLKDKVWNDHSQWQMQQDMPIFRTDNLQLALSNTPDSFRCPSPRTLVQLYIPQWVKHVPSVKNIHR
ncbi:putative NRPS-like protein biosynthetic cluster [Aspergillus puulaauensis]|uniref:Putative NRPS-like protein biosynthetic cluster n=1 Tax=Aspergillus puulaauensis TaxID=1220207 RepID=A0A7R7XH30_9EURO|nr:putative NRPS-like protein biosynthetic cluster [Aspergillus puulaauensis]BCS21169.1 putative NRPS-like protein biosynthetic cluster [Aspergillus puulaauensis]